MKEKWRIGTVVLFLIAGTACWGYFPGFTQYEHSEGDYGLSKGVEEDELSELMFSVDRYQKDTCTNVKLLQKEKSQSALSPPNNKSSGAKRSKKGDNRQTYSSMDGLFSFSYPQGWKLLSPEGSDKILLAPPKIDYSPQSKLEVLIVMFSIPLPPDIDIYSESFMTELDDVIRSESPSAKQIDQPKRFTVSNIPALKVDYTGISHIGEKVRVRVYTATKYNNAIILVASMLESKADLYLSDLEDIFRSLRMKEPKKSILDDTYEHYDSGASKKITFYPNGRFERSFSYAQRGTVNVPSEDDGRYWGDTAPWAAAYKGKSEEGT